MKILSIKEGWPLLQQWVADFNKTQPNIQISLPESKPKTRARYNYILSEVYKTKIYKPQFTGNGTLILDDIPDLGEFTSIQGIAKPMAVPGFKRKTVKTTTRFSNQQVQNYKIALAKANEMRARYGLEPIYPALNYRGSYSSLIGIVKKRGTKKYIEGDMKRFKVNALKSIQSALNSSRNLSDEDIRVINQIISKIERTSYIKFYNLFKNESIVTDGGELFGSDQTTISSFNLNILAKKLGIKYTVEFTVANDPDEDWEDDL